MGGGTNRILKTGGAPLFPPVVRLSPIYLCLLYEVSP